MSILVMPDYYEFQIRELDWWIFFLLSEVVRYELVVFVC